MSQYPNPYEFVPLENMQPARRPWNKDEDGIERWHPERYCGHLHCVLHPETPLFVHGEGQQETSRRRFFRLNGQPAISASSLKGAIRSIYEIVTDSCLSALSEKYQVSRSHMRTYGKSLSEREFERQHPIYQPKDRVPGPYLPCTDLDAACPGCLLFGMVEQKPEGKPLAGRLFLSDATLVQTRPIELRIPAAGGGPHPWHSTFYFQDAGEGPILGRKLYFHHRDYRQTLRLYGEGGHAGLLDIEAQLGDFAFQVEFINLTEEELACLAYTLLLEKGICHHLGYGKPYGLGSARILVQRLELWHAPTADGTARFLQLNPGEPPGEPLEDWAARGKANWLKRPGARSAYDTFARILAWPGTNLYQYPEFTWFRRTEGSGNITLAEYQQGVRSKPITTSPRPPRGPTPTGPRPPRETAPSPSDRRRGRVQRFDPDSSYGFIEVPGQQRGLFVHINNVRGKVRLRPGQEVEYSIGSGPKGDQAVDVQPL